MSLLKTASSMTASMSASSQTAFCFSRFCRQVHFKAATLVLGLLVCSMSFAGVAAAANAFNPHTGKPMPTARTVKGEDAKILQAIGGRPRSIATDAAHRPHWREELYPVLQGSMTAPHEVLVVLDMASPKARTVWAKVREVAARTAPEKARFVLFGKSRELYATDLIGLAIWAARERKGQAMDYVSWALGRWDEIKAGQKAKGQVKPFIHEYDAVLTRKDYPMVFVAMERFKPAVPAKDQSALARYAYDAGNVNLYQTTEVCAYYGIKDGCGVVVDGRLLSSLDELATLLR